MKLVRFGSEELTRSITPSAALACWGWTLPTLICIASAPGVLIGLIASLFTSARLGAWLGTPVVLALNLYFLWRGRLPRLNWVVAGSADRVFVRLFVRRTKRRSETQEPDVIVLEASEIASISAQAIEVYVYGPKPRMVERLVIKPVETAAADFSYVIGSVLRNTGVLETGKQAFVANEEGLLVMEWKCCRPALREFLKQIARECPSLTIAPEERTELDLNGIWHGLREEPDKEQRRMLAQAIRLGFGCELPKLLWLGRSMPYGQTRPYLAEILREEEEAKQSVASD